MNFWNDKKVLVTGGAGFIGSHVVEQLVERGADVTIIDNLTNGDLNNIKSVSSEINFIKGDLRNLEECLKSTKNQKVIMHVAAKVGGIEYNKNHPAIMLRENILMNTNILEAAKINKCERYLAVSTACVYRHDCTIPTPEEEGFIGMPEPTNFGYGWAKRIAEIQAKTYAEEFGMKIGIARPYNAYGPRDHFEPDKSHVIPALMKRIFDGEDPLVAWGSGNQTRAFLYADDFARGLIETIEKYPVPDPINIGTDEEVSIKNLVGLILKYSGKNPKVVYDTNRPEGQPRRNCDTTKAKRVVGFEARVRLEDGIKSTIEWYKQNVL